MAYPTGSFSIEAPDDSDTNDYSAKGYSTTITNLNQYATITRGGVARFGPVADPSGSGKTLIRHEIRSGDPLRHSGNRSELSYDKAQIANGIDYWFAFAIKLDSVWVQANSGGNGDRQSLMQVHDVGSGTNPMGFAWEGTNAGTYGNGEIVVRQALRGVDMNPIFRISAKAGSWMRVILHYRSGPSSSFAPKMEMWTAFDSGSYIKATALASDTSPWGEDQTSASGWPKIGIYKWTTGSYGAIPNRGMYSTGLFFGQGTNLYNEAAASLAGI